MNLRLSFSFLTVALGIAFSMPSYANSDLKDKSAVEHTDTVTLGKKGEYKFDLKFEPTKIKEMVEVRKKLINNGVINKFFKALSQEMALPKNIPVTFKDCDNPNAFWSPEEKSLTMCYELISLYNKSYADLKSDEKSFLSQFDQDAVVIGTTTFIVLHELGHGLVDIYKLPITGREEDAVDQFATIALIGDEEEKALPVEKRSALLALLGAYFFKEIADDPNKLQQRVLSDEHSLGQQRYYDVMCLVLGSDPKTYQPILMTGADLVEKAFEANQDKIKPEQLVELLNKTDSINILPYERGLRCEEEYKRYSASWEYLLDTFVEPKENKQIQDKTDK